MPEKTYRLHRVRLGDIRSPRTAAEPTDTSMIGLSRTPSELREDLDILGKQGLGVVGQIQESEGSVLLILGT